MTKQERIQWLKDNSWYVMPSSPEVSEKIQLVLFELGFGWGSGAGKVLLHQDKPYIAFDKERAGYGGADWLSLWSGAKPYAKSVVGFEILEETFILSLAHPEEDAAMKNYYSMEKFLQPFVRLECENGYTYVFGGFSKEGDLVVARCLGLIPMKKEEASLNVRAVYDVGTLALDIDVVGKLLWKREDPKLAELEKAVREAEDAFDKAGTALAAQQRALTEYKQAK